MLLGQWTFISIFTDGVGNMNYGMRYYLNQTTYSQNAIFGSRSKGPSYQLLSTTKVYLGGDPYFSTCRCYLQYVRMYWNYVADSEDKMINLAMMDARGIFIDHFSMRTYSRFFLHSIKQNSIDSISHRIHKQTTI